MGAAESSGGTHSETISSQDCFIVSRGGDGVCCFYDLDKSKVCQWDWNKPNAQKVSRMSVYTAGVSALTTCENFIVLGGENRVL